MDELAEGLDDVSAPAPEALTREADLRHRGRWSGRPTRTSSSAFLAGRPHRMLNPAGRSGPNGIG